MLRYLLRLTRKLDAAFREGVKFRTAYIFSALVHALILVSVTWIPSESQYRFYGSGTAVTLVGADQIPGGSARGKSGDRPEARREAARSARRAAKKLAAKKVRRVKKKKRRRRKVRRRARKPKKVHALKRKHKKVRRKKTKKQLEREARRRELRRRRERERRFRERFYKTLAREKKTRQQQVARAPRRPVRRRPEADLPPPEPPRPRAGHPGEGGGDGQGGGSLGGGSGGASRTHLERYYGLLADRVRNNWTIPTSMEGVERLRATVIVDVGRDGSIQNLELKDSSGQQAYDRAALRAVAKAATPSFPPPPNTVKDTWILLGFRFCGRNFCR